MTTIARADPGKGVVEFGQPPETDVPYNNLLVFLRDKARFLALEVSQYKYARYWFLRGTAGMDTDGRVFHSYRA